MAIDTGLPQTYDPNYPVPGVTQPSQQFRDNFTVIKAAIENLQTATAADGSVIQVVPALGDAGHVYFQASYTGNALTLPQGAPTRAIQPGMIRYEEGLVQYHNGTDWISLFTLGARVNNGLNVSYQNKDKFLVGDTVQVSAPLIVTSDYIRVPQGTTNSRPTNAVSGTFRYNNDQNTWEFFSQDRWALRVARAEITESLAIQNNPIGPNDAINLAYLNARLADLPTSDGSGILSTAFDDNIEEGVSAIFDSTRGKVNLSAKDFTITLDGVVQGSATVTKLSDVTIHTTSNFRSGITVQKGGINVSPVDGSHYLNFTGNGVTVTQTGEVSIIDIPTILTPRDVRDQIGATVKGTIRDQNTHLETETGITTNYDATNNTVELGVREFDVTLTGAVTGTGHSSRLQDIVINTTTDRIKGVQILTAGTPLGAPETVKVFNLIGDAITAVQNGNKVDLTFTRMSPAQVRDIVGGFVRGTVRDPNVTLPAETGITTNYDSTNNVLEIGVREFDVNITGAVTGTGHSSRLGDIDIFTSTDLIKGVTVQDHGNIIGLDQSVQSFNFTGSGVTVSQSGGTATVNIPQAITITDVRNTIGTTIKGTVREQNSNVETETGITVNYDAGNNVVELGVREFNINLAGAVSGTAKVSKLHDVTITTTSDRITGVTILDEGVRSGDIAAVKNLNFVGSGLTATVVGDTAKIEIVPDLDASEVRGIVTNLISGSQLGVDVTYDAPNQKIKFQTKPITLTLTGAIQGSGTISFTGGQNDGSLLMVTSGSALGSGLEVRDEGNVRGTAVSSINFVGGGVTSAVTVDGELATVFIPNSPGNEKFLVLDNGSENVPNARVLSAGTGISINDGGPGGIVTISAESDAILARTQVLLNGILVGSRSIVDFNSTQDIRVIVQDNDTDNRLDIAIYSLADGWWREPSYDCGSVTDHFGGSVDFGTIVSGIIQYPVNLGYVNSNAVLFAVGAKRFARFKSIGAVADALVSAAPTETFGNFSDSGSGTVT
jgi:hypothetical protein